MSESVSILGLDQDDIEICECCQGQFMCDQLETAQVEGYEIQYCEDCLISNN